MTESKKPGYGDYIHVVAAIIWQSHNRDRLLISRRQKGKHLEGYWELPGGKIEAGESCQQALYRELKEEVDIVPLKTNWFDQTYCEYEDKNVLLDVWEVSSFKGHVVAREGQSVRWVAVNQLSQFEFPAADTPILESIMSNVIEKKERLP